MALHYKFSDANVSLVRTHIRTLHIRKYNNYKCKATTSVMMQVVMKDYKHATVLMKGTKVLTLGAGR